MLKWDPEGGRLGDYKMDWCLGHASYDDNSQVWWAGTTKCGHEEAHGLAVAQTPGTLECPPGSLLSYVTKEAGSSEVQYQCAFMAAMGSCVQTETPKFAKMDVQFMQTEIWCNDGMALQSIYLQETDDGGAASNSFRYYCCYITGLPASTKRVICVLSFSPPCMFVDFAACRTPRLDGGDGSQARFKSRAALESRVHKDLEVKCL